jgi:hypothetical protein
MRKRKRGKTEFIRDVGAEQPGGGIAGTQGPRSTAAARMSESAPSRRAAPPRRPGDPAID